MSSSDLVGVNLTQMVQLQQTFETRAAQIDDLIATISNLVGSSGAPGSVHWQGKLADDFRAEWEAVYVRNLRQLVDALHDQARYVNESRRRSNFVLNGIDA